MAITAEEADALLEAGGVPEGPCGPTLWLAACVDSILPVPADEETRASRAALFAAASSFLAGDPRAEAWAEGARSLAASFPASACRAPQIELVLSQGALSKRLAGGLPIDFDAVIGGIQIGRASSSCSPFPSRYETAEPVDVVSPGESLAIAIRDSHVVASYLMERYLWQFPPGSQCEIDDEDGEVFRGSRF